MGFIGAVASDRGGQVMDIEADQMHDRAVKLLDQIPTLGQAMGCLDCQRVFRTGGLCPYCSSKSIFNIATILEES